MIHIQLEGGLGNQLFQYACARNIQIESKMKVALYTGLYKNDKQRKYSLSNYKLNENVIKTEKMLPFFANDISNPLIRLAKKICPNILFKLLTNINVYIWKSERYRELPIKTKKDIYLNGFWQCEKYFSNIRPILQKEFELKETTISNLEILDKIKNEESVCLHIRRGDFINTQHQVCNDAYYYKAISLVKKNTVNPKFYVFSDDIEWVKKNMEFKGEFTYIDDNNADYLELFLMSNCKHFIMSNSSFSWWAQYLGFTDDSYIVAPSRWYNKKSTVDIFQAHWVQIEV
jgi:hypothetical protein